MENILRSFIERFNRLTYTQKFNVITIIFVLPVIAFIPLLSDQNARIDHYGRKEFFGTLYLRPLWQLTEDLQTHELTSQRYRNGDAGLSELEAIQTSIEEGFRTLRSLHDEYRENLPLGTEADDLYTQWLELKTATLDDDAATIDRLEADLYTSIQELVAHIGDISYLILDPDLDTYYMMDTVLLKLPDNQALLLEVHQLAGSAANAQSLSVSQRAQFAILLSRIESNLIEMERNLGVALENDNSGVMSSLVSQPMQEYQANLRAFLELINTEVANPPSPQISTGPVTAVLERQFDEARQANQAFYPAASQALEKGITARVNAMILRLYFIGIIALFSVLGAFALGQTVMNAISEPLVQLADAAQRLASGDMTTRIPVQHTDELGQVSDAFNQMAEELEKDKTTITARALDLEMANQISEKRAGELQAISEISRIISTEQRLDTLLGLITKLVSERFDFYHVGIFLIDSAQQFAVLQAANSEGGQRMLARGHKLEVGHLGMVGNVAQTGIPRIALDVGADAVYFDNPDLPNTRSEMALPLNLRGQTVGVLDIQSLKPAAFNESDAYTLGILADQIAITIDNAQLFTQSQQALRELQALYRQYQAQAWDAYTKRETSIGYHQFPVGGKLLEQPIESDDIEEVLEKGEIRVTQADHGTSNASVVIPVKLRGQVIGVLSIKPPRASRTWNQDEINLMNAISDRLALALDNARLLQESQRRAAKEQKIGDVTAKIGASINMRSVLQTAVEELGRALPGSEVIIQFEQNGK